MQDVITAIGEHDGLARALPRSPRLKKCFPTIDPPHFPLILLSDIIVTLPIIVLIQFDTPKRMLCVVRHALGDSMAVAESGGTPEARRDGRRVGAVDSGPNRYASGHGDAASQTEAIGSVAQNEVRECRLPFPLARLCRIAAIRSRLPFSALARPCRGPAAMQERIT